MKMKEDSQYETICIFMCPQLGPEHDYTTLQTIQYTIASGRGAQKQSSLQGAHRGYIYVNEMICKTSTTVAIFL